jgi:hypothetical protein
MLLITERAHPSGDSLLHRCVLGLVAGVVSVGLLLAVAAAGAHGVSDEAATFGIAPVAPTTVAKNGHFPDPYLVHQAPPRTTPTLAGTFKELMTCRGGLEARCYRPTHLRADLARPLLKIIRRAGYRFGSTKAHHPYQLRDGSWHMALAITITDPSKPRQRHWNVILHANPVGTRTAGGVPTQWRADTVIAGSLTRRGRANYNGKYFVDHGKLFLLYQKLVSTSPNRFGIVAQRMRTPRRPAKSDPVTLLTPETEGGGYNSEHYVGEGSKNTLKLVETANITRINGKYAMVYSVGGFSHPTYKIGIAWSDTFLPKKSQEYRRQLTVDTTGVWRVPGHEEVTYLMQSEKADWPNYARAAVQAPGVGSIVKAGSSWSLFFAGYRPGEKPQGTKEIFLAKHRTTFYAPLKVAVPQGQAVAETSDAELAAWITLGS